MFARMMRAGKYFFYLLISLSVLCSCAADHGFKKDRNQFTRSKPVSRYKAVADMNDAYFIIKENHFFQFYRLLFDSVQNSRYAGRYTQIGDTLFLHFYNRRGMKILGSKALINDEKKEIIFFNVDTKKKKLLAD